VSAATVEAAPAPAATRRSTRHPIAVLLGRRLALGVVTLVIVSFIVFWATQVLPGNASTAILGSQATPQRLKLLNHQLHLDRGLLSQYWSWVKGLLTGNPGVSLTSGVKVWTLVGPRLANSAALVVVSGVIGTIIGIILGAYAGLKKDRWPDRILSTTLLAVTALPEFVVAIALIVVLSTVVWHILPAVSLLPPGSYAWGHPKLMVLPVATLVIVIVPYLFRMMRAAMIEALESEYVEMARLKGVPPWRVVMFHALPNAIAPTIQVVGLNLLYLAGGIVVVEFVFNFPGVGQGLVSAVSDRDVPVIQFTVVVLAAFYVVVNIVTDLIALLATPRRRLPR
jgi:peptide/nickel transport system permease protein